MMDTQVDGTPPARTFGREFRKAGARSTAVLACVLMVASCAPGEPEAKTDHLCEITGPSEEGKLLREIFRTEEFGTEIQNGTSRLTDRLGDELRKMEPQKATDRVHACAYLPDRQKGAGRATFTFGWVPLDLPKESVRSLPGGIRYEVNGTTGETNDTASLLRVQCDMPGDLGPLSKKALLLADVSYSVNIPRKDVDQATRDRQTVLAYLMTRRVTEALGCENKPLEKEPVVSPLPSR
ncbi:hypothetical protein [Streptomyces sp. NPDC051567]|uniref:hypothetical protein n=1 Tax=Streptomyces sp. NPDC051567 TaxID=3365660 RepID=UPI0037AAF842